MEGLQKAIRNVTKDQSSSLDTSRLSQGLSAALSSSDQSPLLVTRSSRQVVSLWTCSKLCAICFAVGVFAGYTLKRRVRHWASRLLKRLKDD